MFALFVVLLVSISVGYAAYKEYKLMQHRSTGKGSETPRDFIGNAEGNLYDINCLKLHEEIRAFYDSIYADGEEFRKRLEVIFRIRNFIECSLDDPGLNVHDFGSTYTGTYLPNSDIDIIITCRYEMSRKFAAPVERLQEIEKLLTKVGGYQWKVMEPVSHTGIPLLRVVDMKSLIKLDISCAADGTDFALRKCQWINQQIAEYPDVPKIVVALKELLLMHALLDVRSGGISSYALTYLVIFIFQEFSARYSNFGTLLVLFLACFGHVFNHEKQAIIMGDVKSVIVRKRKERQSKYLIILDPVERGCNAGYASSAGWDSARQVFGMTFDHLKQKMNGPVGCGESILHEICE